MAQRTGASGKSRLRLWSGPLDSAADAQRILPDPPLPARDRCRRDPSHPLPSVKVLQLLPELNAGGVERGTLEIAAFLRSRGHEALVVSNSGRLVPELERTGARHIPMPVHRKSLFSLGQVRPLRRWFESERPDIVHLRSRVPAWIAWFAWRGMPAATRPRLVSTVHGFYSVNPYSAVMTRGERVIAVSESIRDYILRHYRRTDPAIIRVIPRGLDPARYPAGFQPSSGWLAQWKSAHPQLENADLLALPGRITRLKGHEDFLELIAALRSRSRPVFGLIIGDAHERKRAYLASIRALAARLGVEDRIVFTGHREDVREIFSQCRVVLSLSRQPESFGRTTLEALALGRPVVGYDQGGVGEQLRSFFPRGRVPVGDRAALQRTVGEILFAPSAPAAVGPPYTLAAMCEATLAAYEELVPPPATPCPGRA